MSTPALPAPPRLPGHPLSLGDVLSATFQFYGRRFGQLLVIALIPTLVTLGTVAAAVALTVTAALRLMGGLDYDVPSWDAGSTGMLVVGTLLLLVVSLIAALIRIKCQGMIALAGRDIEDGRSSTVGDLWRRTRGLAGRAVLLIGLLVVAVIAIELLIGQLVLALSGDPQTDVGDPRLAIVLMLAVIPVGIFLQIRWAFVLQALAIDGAGPIAALGRSWRTSRGAFWRIFGYQLVANLLVGMVGGTVSSILQGILVPRNMPDPESVSALLAQFASLAPFLLLGMVGGLLVALLSGPFLALFTTVLYIDQRRRLGLEPAPMGPWQWGPGYGAGGPGQPGDPFRGQGGPQGTARSYGG